MSFRKRYPDDKPDRPDVPVDTPKGNRLNSQYRSLVPAKTYMENPPALTVEAFKALYKPGSLILIGKFKTLYQITAIGERCFLCRRVIDTCTPMVFAKEYIRGMETRDWYTPYTPDTHDIPIPGDSDGTMPDGQ